MISVIGLLVASIALSAAQYPSYRPPNPYQNMIVSHISQDVAGNFGYATADGQAHQQSVAPDGSVRGTYSYVDASGKPVKVNYVADQHGYRASGDNVPAHAQHVPATPTGGHQTEAQRSGKWLGHAAYERPKPYQQQHAPFGSSPFAAAPPASAFPAPSYSAPHAYSAGPKVDTYNPAAEQQLQQTIQQHAANDQRAQAQQIQQLAAITGTTGAHHASYSAHPPAPAGFVGFQNPFGGFHG